MLRELIGMETLVDDAKKYFIPGESLSKTFNTDEELKQYYRALCYYKNKLNAIFLSVSRTGMTVSLSKIKYKKFLTGRHYNDL